VLSLLLCVVDRSVGWSFPLKYRRACKVVTASFIGLSITSSPGINVYALEDAEAMARFQNSYDQLDRLDSSWDEIVKGEGDNIRRKLGTVYAPPTCDSPLCGISTYIPRFVKGHPEDLDISAFEEPAREFLEAYNQADFLAYSSIFSEYGNGGGGADYIKDARNQVKRAKQAMSEVIKAVKDS